MRGRHRAAIEMRARGRERGRRKRLDVLPQDCWVRSMAGKAAKPRDECERRIKDILDGNVEGYIRWADMRNGALERNREYLKKQVRIAEQRCAAAERMRRMAMESEAGQRERAGKAEKALHKLRHALPKWLQSARAQPTARWKEPSQS